MAVLEAKTWHFPNPHKAPFVTVPNESISTALLEDEIENLTKRTIKLQQRETLIFNIIVTCRNVHCKHFSHCQCHCKCFKLQSKLYKYVSNINIIKRSSLATINTKIMPHLQSSLCADVQVENVQEHKQYRQISYKIFWDLEMWDAAKYSL